MPSNAAALPADTKTLRRFVDALGVGSFVDDAVEAIDPRRLRRACEIAVEIQVENVLADPVVPDSPQGRESARQHVLAGVAEQLRSAEMERFLQAVALVYLEGRLPPKGALLTGLFALALLGTPTTRLAFAERVDELLALDREHFVVLTARCDTEAATDLAWRRRHSALLQGPAFEERLARLRRLEFVGDEYETWFGGLLLRVMAKAVA